MRNEKLLLVECLVFFLCVWVMIFCLRKQNKTKQNKHKKQKQKTKKKIPGPAAVPPRRNPSELEGAVEADFPVSCLIVYLLVPGPA